MTLKTFKSCMQRGLGRCYIELKNCEDREKYKDTVLWGCLHEIAFDAQCEGTRAAFLYRLISLFPDRDFFSDRIAEKYRSVSGREPWLFQQLTELLSYFAEDGHPTAKDALAEKYAALYDRLLKKRSFNSYDYERDDFELLTIVMLRSGEDTFPALISDYGGLFLKNPHYELSCFEWFADRLAETVGKKRLTAELKKHGEDPAWKCFYESYRKLSDRKRERSENRTVISSAEELSETYDGDRMLAISKTISFARNADAHEKKKLVDLIEKESSPEKKAGLLRAFWRENYPGDHEKLIEYAASECEALSAAAKEALLSCRSETVYRYARECLQNDRSDAAAIGILLLNYRKEDKKLLLSVLSELKIDRGSESGWHGVVMQILEVYDRGVRLPREFFAFVYENSLCSCCRYHAVLFMGKRRWLSPQMIEECRYDSNDDIVAYVMKKI